MSLATILVTLTAISGATPAVADDSLGQLDLMLAKVPKGAATREVRARLGEPIQIRGGAWQYAGTTGAGSAGITYNFLVFFRSGKVSRIEVEGGIDATGNRAVTETDLVLTVTVGGNPPEWIEAQLQNGGKEPVVLDGSDGAWPQPRLVLTRAEDGREVGLCRPPFPPFSRVAPKNTPKRLEGDRGALLARWPIGRGRAGGFTPPVFVSDLCVDEVPPGEYRMHAELQTSLRGYVAPRWRKLGFVTGPGWLRILSAEVPLVLR